MPTWASFYLFWKKYFRASGRTLALWLAWKWVTPNQASYLAILIIAPLFWCIYLFSPANWIFSVALGIGLFIKLVLNAVDGIIAEHKNEKTKLGMFLNVGTDIIPDMYIFWLIWMKFGYSMNILLGFEVTLLVYLLWEYIYIALYDTQNVFFGKDLRTIAYMFLAVLGIFSLSSDYLWYYYIIITLIHYVGFGIRKSGN